MSASDLQGEYPVISFASLQMGICPDTRRSPFLPVHLFYLCDAGSGSNTCDGAVNVGNDICRLVVYPGYNAVIRKAVFVFFYLNDQPAAIYGSRYPYDPVICAP